MRALRVPRGNALLITVILVAVLMVLVVGAIRFTGTNRVSAGSKLSADRVAACADVARRTLLSKLRVFGVPIKGLVLNETIPDAVATGDRSTVMTAHYGASAPTATIVDINSGSMSASAASVRGMGNVAPGSLTLGGQYFRVVVKCAEAAPSTREAEVEFVFRYGI